jgi:signal peptidase I
MPLWQELPLLLIVAFCLAVLIRTFLLQAFYIPSGSMENTLLVGDRVLVNKVVYDMRDPARGEVVVFRGTDAWVPENTPDSDIGFFAKLGRTVGDLVGISRPGEKDFIKRVIGLPGDRVSCCDVDGRVFVNGQPLDEPYVTENAQLETPPNAKECVSRRFDEVLVEPGQIFVMGDHRLVSQDSRCQGQVPIENVIGRAFVIVWPSGRWTSLSVPPTFENVPAPYAAGESARLTPELTAVTGGSVDGGAGAPSGDLGIVAPILLTLLLPARSRLSVPARRRRLRG